MNSLLSERFRMSESVSVIITPRTGAASFGSSFALPWTRVYFRKSLDEICSYLEIETNPKERTRVKTHDQIQLRLSNGYVDRPVVTCYIDDIDSESSAKKKTMKITARSAARDIIDSTWSGSITSPKKLLEIVSIVAKPFGIKVYHMPKNTDGTKLVQSFEWENESPWQKLIQESDNQGYLITSNQVGDLYVWPVATGARLEGFSLVEGQGIVSIKDHESGSEQFNKYVFNGADKTATRTDSDCKTSRLLTLNLTDKELDAAALDRRIKTEMLRRRNRRLTIGVRNWGLPPDTLSKMTTFVEKEVLWEINFFTPVKIPSMGIDASMLVSQVEGRADGRSIACNIQLASPEAYR